MVMFMTKTAAIYTRISRDRQGEALGVGRQEKACRELCKQKGWQVLDVYSDNDVSAYSGKARPRYTAMLSAIEAKDADLIVAWAPDRLTRSNRELETLIDLVEKAHAEIATVEAGLYDLSTPAGRMSARVVGSVARFESEQKSARLKLKAAQIASTGKNGGGGSRPFGFEDDRITIRESEAAVIRLCAERIIAGWTLRGTARRLVDDGVLTVSGKQWTITSLKRILVAHRTAGIRAHLGQAVCAAEWPGIVDETTHHQLRAILLDPDRRPQGAPHKYILTGFAVCTICEAKLVARPNGRKARCYVCARGIGFSGCGGIRQLSETLEQFVFDAVIALVDSGELPKAPAPSIGSDDGLAITELQRLDDELAGLADDYAAGLVPRAAFIKASARLESASVEQRRNLKDSATSGQMSAAVYQDVSLGERWPGMTFDQRRIVIGALIEEVRVAPAVKGRNFFDSGRITIKWRA
jgi:site-specific DNA recombinase